MRKLTLITFCLLTSLLFSCKETKEDSSFDRKPILENLQSNIIMPTYKDFIERAKSLDTAISTFNENPTAARLTAVREQWKVVAISWKAAELFNFGPIKDFLITNTIDYWPTDPTGIENSIKLYTPEPNYLASQGSNKKGIPAIEYLLFHAEKNIIIDSFQQEKRKAYLSLLSKDLVTSIERVNSEWINTYGASFASKTGNKAKDGLTLVANQMIAVIEEVKSMKIGEPAGKMGLKQLEPNKVESPYANLSAEMAAENIRGIKRVFNGEDGIGMDDYLVNLDIKDENDQLLSERINQHIDKIEKSFAAIQPSLQQAIIDKNPALDALYLQLIDLSILVHNDMMSQLDLLTVYSDNDGD